LFLSNELRGLCHTINPSKNKINSLSLVNSPANHPLEG
jgi:hypothetical protein